MSNNQIHTRIWREEPEQDNPYATRTAYCHGYDVFGQMLGNARWVEMLYLLFRAEAPTTPQADLLETLAIALANPGPRDASVHAAMCGGVGGSSAAAALIAALSVGAGSYRGAREIFDAMHAWAVCHTDINVWQNHLNRDMKNEIVDTWPVREHPPGFDPYGVTTATSVCQLLETLSQCESTPRLTWLASQRLQLEAVAGHPLDISGVAAATFADLGFEAQEGEMLYLLLRLPGAAAHALEQGRYGFKQFPFYPVELEDDPALKEKP